MQVHRHTFAAAVEEITTAAAAGEKMGAEQTDWHWQTSWQQRESSQTAVTVWHGRLLMRERERERKGRQ